jgi:hypothetical protein
MPPHGPPSGEREPRQVRPLRAPPIPCARTEGGFRRKNRRALRAPVELNLCKTGFRGPPCCLDDNNTLNGSRAGSGAPVGSYLCKTGFRGSPCCLDDSNTLRVPDRAPPLAHIFVKPGSGARRVVWMTTTRFACRIGRIPCAVEKHTRFADVRLVRCAFGGLACAAEAGCLAGVLKKPPHNRIPVGVCPPM